MPKKRKSELIRCLYFAWRLGVRDGVYYADGHSNNLNAGRHSLGCKTNSEAIERLARLDEVRAADLGLIPRSAVHIPKSNSPPLSVAEGRKLYEGHIARPMITGGVRKSTRKRYRTVFDKFTSFARDRRCDCWQNVDERLVNAYIAHLEGKGYAGKTLRNEVQVIKQTIRWLIEAEHLSDKNPLKLPLRRVESQRAYCWTKEEVDAIIAHCRENPELAWLANVVIALACTGMRISELVGLRWTDINLERDEISLTDETFQGAKHDKPPRTTKGGYGRRFPLHVALKIVLDQMSRRDGYVFRGPRGGRLKSDTVRRILVRDALNPLAARFPGHDGQQSFRDGRLHSFRHYFASACANDNVPENMLMEWLGHRDSEMVRHYYHVHRKEAQRRMNGLNLLGDVGGRSVDEQVRSDSLTAEEASSRQEHAIASPELTPQLDCPSD